MPEPSTQIEPGERFSHAEACLQTIEELGLLNDEHPPAFDRVVEISAALMRAPFASFSVITDREYISKAVRGLDHCRINRETTLCHHTLQQEDHLVVPDTLKDERLASNAFVTGGPKIRFYAGFKVLAPNGLPVGTVCVMDQKPRIITEDDISALQQLRDLLQENLLLRARAITDPLTGAFNRRHFDEMLDKEWRRAYRHMLPVSLLMVDVDHFKRYNDHYGHVAGDHALCAVAGVLEALGRRAGDIIGRFGGEEFSILLPETDLQAARRIATQINDAVRELAIPHAMSPAGVITVSIGGTVVTDHQQMAWGSRSLIEAADKHLYSAKEQGRDQACVQSFTAPEGELENLVRQ